MANTNGLICFVGPDGCGKTTQVDGLIAHLKAEGVESKYVWLRFFHLFSIPILLAGRLLNYTEVKHYGDGTIIGIHHFSKSKLLSSIYIITTTIDMFIAILIKISIPRAIGKKTIVCDRFTYDALVDLMVSTGKYDLYRKKTGRALNRLVPRGASVITLLAEPSIITQRRPDVLHDPNFNLRVRLYGQISEYFGLPVIDTSLSEEKVRDMILARME
jgi:thymidylate kinase